MRRKAIAAGATALFAVVAVAGCSSSSQASALNKDQTKITRSLSEFEVNQPIPQANYSEYRAALIGIENAQIHGVATTTFFFQQGDSQPIKSCPSVGYPIASTSQLTNPEQIVNAYGRGNSTYTETVPQLEPNGVYTGDSSGTYVVCVANGQHAVDYWEGYVETEGGPAHWDGHKIVLDGAPTVTDHK